MHYLNAEPTALTPQVHVDLTLDTTRPTSRRTPAPSSSTTRSSTCPRAPPATASMRCLIPQRHHAPLRVRRTTTRAGWATGRTSTPPRPARARAVLHLGQLVQPDNAQLSMPIPAGSRIRFDCDYDNSRRDAGVLRGPERAENEMCMFVGTYYPAMGQQSDFCETGPDMFGTGTAACGATLGCFQACGGKVAVGAVVAGYSSPCPTASKPAWRRAAPRRRPRSSPSPPVCRAAASRSAPIPPPAGARRASPRAAALSTRRASAHLQLTTASLVRPARARRAAPAQSATPVRGDSSTPGPGSPSG